MTCTLTSKHAVSCAHLLIKLLSVFQCISWSTKGTDPQLTDKYFMSPVRLKEKGRNFREVFLQKLGLLLRGTVSAPPERFGETLADEHIRGGATFDRVVLSECGDNIAYSYSVQCLLPAMQ